MIYDKRMIGLLNEIKQALSEEEHGKPVVSSDLTERILQLHKSTDDELVRDVAASFLRYIDMDVEQGAVLDDLIPKQYVKIYDGQLIDD